MRILYVCTANICRSPSAQQLMRESVAAAPMRAPVQVLSAGTHSIPGAPGCSVAPALVGHAQHHHSQPLTAELLAWADLILPAARDHRPAIIGLDLASRERTFTIRQAGRIVDWLIDAGMVEAARERARTTVGESALTFGEPIPPRAAAAWADRFVLGDPRRVRTPTTSWIPTSSVWGCTDGRAGSSVRRRIPCPTPPRG